MYKVQSDAGIHNRKRIVLDERYVAFSKEKISGLEKKYIIENIKGGAGLFMPY
jgi:hypothetical protein